MNRPSLTLLARVLVLAAVAVGARTARAQQDYPQTLYWGSGLVDIPVAWVSPVSGDFALNYSGKHFEVDPTAPTINYNSRLNSQLGFSMAFFRRVELGLAAYSSNPEEGGFGHLLLLRDDDFRGRGGAAHWLPSVAVGMRNIGPYKRIDRFGAGYALLPPTPGEPNARHVADQLHARFNTANTVFGVATKGFALSDIRPSWPDLNLSFSVGYGNGLFKNHGDLPVEQYAKHSTGGLFYGAKGDVQLSPNTNVALMAENNAWDFNLGANLSYRGVRAGLYWTEIGAGSANVVSGQQSTVLYNYSKVAFTVGWQSNVFALLRGNFLQNRMAQLERERAQLLAEITRRQQRIAALQQEINRYEAQNLLELEQRRAEAEAELRQERDALRRLEERLRRIESQNPAPPPGPTPR